MVSSKTVLNRNCIIKQASLRLWPLMSFWWKRTQKLPFLEILYIEGERIPEQNVLHPYNKKTRLIFKPSRAEKRSSFLTLFSSQIEVKTFNTFLYIRKELDMEKSFCSTSSTKRITKQKIVFPTGVSNILLIQYWHDMQL